jgi:membrane-bound serine protease (ClpP class)
MVAGIMGVVFLIAGITWMYAYEGAAAGHITLVSALAATGLAIYASLKTRAWRRFGLQETIDSHVNDVVSLNISEGSEGVTVSALRPSGTIQVGDKRVEANTNGEMIDAGTKVVVVKVFPNKVLVRVKRTEL